MRRTRTRSCLLGVAALSLVLTACAGDPEPVPDAAPEPGLSEEMPTSIVGPDESTLFASGDSPFANELPDDAPIDPRSAELVAQMVSPEENPVVSVNGWTMPIYEADSSTPRYTVEPTAEYSPPGWVLRDVPVPDGAAPDPQDDGHMVVVDREAGCVYEFWQASRDGDGWTASWANATPIDGDGIYPDGLSSRASGLSAAAGLIWPQDLIAGEINHALAFAYPFTEDGVIVAPATATDGTTSDVPAIPEGARLRLDPTLDLDSLGLNAVQRTIAEALQRYGMILADTSGGLSLYAAAPQSFETFPYPESWTTGIWANMSAIPFDRMQVLEMTEIERHTGPPITNECTEGAFGGDDD